MNEKNYFKTCPGCFIFWDSREAFLSDPNLELNGYKADFKDLEYGMFFFTHKTEPCYSTMTMMVAEADNFITDAGPTSLRR